jgi:hypothetical protein
MSDDSGYDHFGGSDDPSDHRVPFSETGPAIVWVLITIGIGMMLLGGVGVGIWLTTSNSAALGFTVPLAMCALFIVPAVFASGLRTARDLKHRSR